MTTHDREQGFTREESRWIDGELDEQAASRFEARLKEDPARAARLRAYRDAVDLWRDDADRMAGGLDPRRLADRVLAGGSLDAERAARSSRRYAAAALLLIGLGLAGASAIGPDTAQADGAPVQTALQLIEQDRLEVQTAREWEAFPLVHTSGNEKER